MASVPSPEHIGPYQLLQTLGEGGMGTVYLAEQREPVRRRVALKVVKLGMDSRAVLARFEAERQALSMMDHSSVARIFDAGITEQGRPYFAMEYVKGVPITDYCDRNKLSIADRIDLFRQVCSGVQHAHLKGVMHRDLKPGNVLVTLQDGKPVPKIIDFGLAKAVDHRLVEATVFTELGQVIGTPEYMSPEQAGLDGLDVDTRTDVYSLGVLLYELLTGDLPFSRAELRRAGYLEMQRILRENEPVKPSTRLTTHGASATEMAMRRGVGAGELQRRLRGDLDWIVMKALEKDRTRRYETALELAADLDRHLQHLPVLAGKPGVGYRVKKFVRRYRGQVGAAVVVVLVLVVGVVGTTLGFLRAREKVREFNQLAGVVQQKQARESEAALGPPWPEQIPAMERWLANDFARPMDLRSEIEQTARDLAATATSSFANGREEPGALVFRDEASRFLHDALVGLQRDLDELEQVGKSVRERLRWAQRIAEVTRRHPHAKSWEEARKSIAEADDQVASKLYREHPIDLVPQMGLVPIGMNPVTKLWEFYELRSAWDPAVHKDPADLPIPSHGPDGRIAVGEATGIVFVLVPGGTFTMGASDADGVLRANIRELPQKNVTLSPFFLARYEMTQGQWKRLSGGEQPSNYGLGYSALGVDAAVNLAHPVEQIDWSQCNKLLTNHGFVLPTEAQWEWSCRALTTTPWWTGAEEASLKSAANVFDQRAKKADWAGDAVEWDDGFLLHAPVGSLRPNEFGLHDMHGNVWEWCRDVFSDYEKSAPRPGDGLRAGKDENGRRVARGGSFGDIARAARSASRAPHVPSLKYRFLGVRAARELRRG